MDIPRYDIKQYKNLFTRKAKFHVPLHYYLEISESDRVRLYLKTKLMLQHLDKIENYTSIVRESISEKTAITLAQAVISITNAFEEHIENLQASGKINLTTEEFQETVNEHKGSSEYKEFKTWRFISLYEDDLAEEAKNKETKPLPEREIIFDCILDMWKQAARNKGLTENRQNYTAQDSIDARNRKADFNKSQKARMEAYLEYFKTDPYSSRNGAEF